jgi:hypothetical protein
MSPGDYERTEQGDDPSCPTRLTDEQLRDEWRRMGHPNTVEMITSILALRARVAKLEAALKPFAAVAEDEDNPPFWDETPKTEFADDDEYWSVFYQGLRAKHFRAARAALRDAPL